MRITLITIIALFFLAPIARADTVYNGLVGYWPLDARDYTTSTTVLDRSGNGNTGTLTPSTANQFTSTSTVPGKMGQALKFNGTSQYVNMGNASTLGVEGSPFTASAWVKVAVQPSSGVSYEIVGKEKSGNGGWGWKYSNGSGTYYLNLVKSGVADQAYSYTLTAGIWYHVVAVQSATQVQYFVNGKSIFTYSNSSAYISSSGRPANIGAANSSSNYFSGSLDDVRVYNRALSAAEVRQLYREEGGDHQNSFLETITSIISNLI